MIQVHLDHVQGRALSFSGHTSNHERWNNRLYAYVFCKRVETSEASKPRFKLPLDARAVRQIQDGVSTSWFCIVTAWTVQCRLKCADEPY